MQDYVPSVVRARTTRMRTLCQALLAGALAVPGGYVAFSAFRSPETSAPAATVREETTNEHDAQIDHAEHAARTEFDHSEGVAKIMRCIKNVMEDFAQKLEDEMKRREKEREQKEEKEKRRHEPDDDELERAYAAQSPVPEMLAWNIADPLRLACRDLGYDPQFLCIEQECLREDAETVRVRVHVSMPAVSDVVIHEEAVASSEQQALFALQKQLSERLSVPAGARTFFIQLQTDLLVPPSDIQWVMRCDMGQYFTTNEDACAPHWQEWKKIVHTSSEWAAAWKCAQSLGITFKHPFTKDTLTSLLRLLQFAHEPQAELAVNVMQDVLRHTRQADDLLLRFPGDEQVRQLDLQLDAPAMLHIARYLNEKDRQLKGGRLRHTPAVRQDVERMWTLFVQRQRDALKKNTPHPDRPVNVVLIADPAVAFRDEHCAEPRNTDFHMDAWKDMLNSGRSEDARKRAHTFFLNTKECASLADMRERLWQSGLITEGQECTVILGVHGSIRSMFKGSPDAFTLSFPTQEGEGASYRFADVMRAVSIPGADYIALSCYSGAMARHQKQAPRNAYFAVGRTVYPLQIENGALCTLLRKGYEIVEERDGKAIRRMDFDRDGVISVAERNLWLAMHAGPHAPAYFGDDGKPLAENTPGKTDQDARCDQQEVV